MRHASTRTISLAIAMACASSACRAADAVDVALHADAQPLFESHCFDCHGHGAAEGALALDELLAKGDTPEARQQWRKVWKMVRQEFMPPVDATELPAADRRAMTQWIEQAALGVDYARPDPGRVTMRRLNRMEYEFTIGDLFGVDPTTVAAFSSDGAGAVETRLRDMLPPDDTAYGFDNIGDFQSLSPALLEKYFDIAEFVVANVIVVDGPWYPSQQLLRDAFEVDRERAAHRVQQRAKFQVDRTGRYRLDVQFSLGGWQEYGGRFEFSWQLDGEEADVDEFDVGGQKRHAYQCELTLEPGEHELMLATHAIKEDSHGELQELQLNPRVTITGPIAPEAASYPESHQRIFFAGDPPADPANRREYAAQILERTAARAFRRPAPPEVVERLTDIAMADDDFERGVGQALVAMLTSPRFLFRTELQPQPDDPGAIHSIDDYALASRLSYLLWLSLPDAELTDIAARGELRANFPAQVRRMLADRKSERFFEDFAGQWLRTRNVLMTAISREEEVIDPVRGAMKRETEMLFEDIVRGDRDLIELVTADYTFVNEQLARYYGLPRVEGGEFRRVEIPIESRRGGILTHGSFLVSTSNPDRTSPVKRGLFVLENLLATQPPPPPANVPPLESAHVDGKRLRTVREQLEAHRADPSCAACHAHFDPIGIALENYDVIGRWRDDERGAAIDPSGVTVTGDELAGIDELRDYIAGQKPRFYRCVAEKLMTYALGRGLEPYDAVTIDRITDELLAGGGKFSTLLLAVVESPAFLTRRGDDAAELQLAPQLAIPETPPPDQRRPERRRRRRFRDFERESAEVERAAAEDAVRQRETDDD
jgi:mono/diheme cytochrome c family protein